MQEGGWEDMKVAILKIWMHYADDRLPGAVH